MSESNDVSPAEDETARAQQDGIRRELLTSGLYDWVPLIEVMQVTKRYDASATAEAVQGLAVRTIRSLVADGLMLIGDLPYPGEKFRGWDLALDAAMERVRGLLVGHYAEPDRWEFIVWMGLTPSGEQLARDLENQRQSD